MKTRPPSCARRGAGLGRRAGDIARPSGSQGTGRLYPVVLNVYDLSPVNDYISWLGLGFYHSGLEIDGREWSFGSGAGSGTGVFECRPLEVPAFRKAVPLGNLDMTSMQIEKAVWDLARDYPGSRYDLLRCNCNSFSGDLAARLGGARPIMGEPPRKHWSVFCLAAAPLADGRCPCDRWWRSASGHSEYSKAGRRLFWCWPQPARGRRE